jgi:hypothetical protein
VFSPWEIVLRLCSDGKSMFSSRYSIWPVFLCIMNLPPTLRYQIANLILVDCYPGPEAPKSFRSFLAPLLSEIRILMKGVQVENAIDPTHKTLFGKVCSIC